MLHVRAVPDEPWRNEPVLSRDPDEVLAASGSRYAPASPGEGLALVEAAPGPCVVIGKPCDIAGVRQAARLRPELAERIDLTIAVFCAGTPSTRGTLEMLAAMGVDRPRRPPVARLPRRRLARRRPSRARDRGAAAGPRP